MYLDIYHDPRRKDWWILDELEGRWQSVIPRSKAQLDRRLLQLRQDKYRAVARRPLPYEVQRLMSFLKSNSLPSNRLSENEVVVTYRRKEIAYMDFSNYFTRKMYVAYYDSQLAQKAGLKGKYVLVSQGMLVLEYSKVSDMADDILTLMVSTYVAYKPFKYKLQKGG